MNRMSIPKIRKEVNSRLQPLMQSLSFKKQKEGIYLLDLKNDVLGWIGFPDVNRRNILGIYPVVGLRHLVLEAVCSELASEKPTRQGQPSVGIVMGYLMPERQFLEWTFAGENDDDVYDNLVDAIRTYALPFMRENASLEKINQLMESYDFIVRHERAKKWPIVKLLLGKRDQAMQVMDDYIGLLESEGRDEAVEDHKKYRALIEEKVDWIQNYKYPAKAKR